MVSDWRPKACTRDLSETALSGRINFPFLPPPQRQSKRPNLLKYYDHHEGSYDSVSGAMRNSFNNQIINQSQYVLAEEGGLRG